jgi:hypothetical protein
MEATFCLLTCALALAQPAEQTDWTLGPRLSRGQELVYRGTVTEEALGKAVQFSRSYRLESRAFILDAPARGLEVALLTILKNRSARPEGVAPGDPSAVRLELVHVDPQGKLTGDANASLAASLDGPATVECGAFVELPRARVTLNKPWVVAEPGRTPHTWKATGTEVINGASCLRVEGFQQSEDWEQPRGDHTAWRRRDLVWLAPRLGVAYRVERTIELREPARTEPTQRQVTRYELESSLQYPGQLFEDRRREILQARTLQENAAPLLPNPGNTTPRQFEVILAKISYHLDNQPPTPYREAVLQVKRRVEAAQRGESAVTPLHEETGPTPTVAKLGQVAPDFVVTNLLTRESFRLRHSVGRPILMVFYSPTSVTAEEVLRFALTLSDKHPQKLAVIGFAVSDETNRVRKQQADMRLSIPILSGKGIRTSYAVDATPKLVVLDADEVVRGSWVGWGQETPAAVTEELQKWLKDARPRTGAGTEGRQPTPTAPPKP